MKGSTKIFIYILAFALFLFVTVGLFSDTTPTITGYAVCSLDTELTSQCDCESDNDCGSGGWNTYGYYCCDTDSDGIGDSCQASTCDVVETCSYAGECETEDDCNSYGGNWCDTYCNEASYACPACNSGSVGNCENSTSCSTAGGNWCDTVCQSGSCPASTNDTDDSSNDTDTINTTTTPSSGGGGSGGGSTTATTAPPVSAPPSTSPIDSDSGSEGSGSVPDQDSGVNDLSGATKEDECNGCLLNSTCVPLGHRAKLGQNFSYCALDGTFYFQVNNGGECLNNYECFSNECRNNECVSTYNLLQKFFDLLKGFFGG